MWRVWVPVMCLLAAMAGGATECLGRVAVVRADGLYVQSVPDGAATRVATGHTARPCWSNSGRWLAFDDEQPGVLVVDSLRPGAVPRRIPAAYSVDCDWSPIADVLAFCGDGGLYLLHPDTWRITTLIPAKPHGRVSARIESPRWSPDGRRLAFTAFLNRVAGQNAAYHLLVSELHTIRCDGGGRRVLVPGNPRAYPAPHFIPRAWSPDGRWVTYLRAPEVGASILNGPMPLYAVPANGGRPHLLLPNTFLEEPLAFSPDSRQVAVIVGSDREAWWRRQLTAIDLRTGRARLRTPADQVAFTPAWSPRGPLAWTQGPVVPPLRGTYTDAQTETAMPQRRLVQRTSLDAATQPVGGDAWEECPLWSADGRHLLSVRLDAKRDSTLWVKPDGDTPRQVGTLDAAVDDYYGDLQWFNALTYWRGQRLARSGLDTERNLLAPLRDTVEALGGSLIATHRGRVFDVALNGVTAHLTLNTDVPPARSGTWPLSRRDGVVYIGVQELADNFHLTYAWNAVTREAVLKSKHRIAIVPTHPLPNPPAPVAGVHPLAYFEGRANGGAYLVGGVAGGPTSPTTPWYAVCRVP